MKKSTAALILVLIGFVSVLITVATGYISNYNVAVAAESGIKAQYETNQNSLSAYTTKVAEAAQVPAMMRDDLKDVMKTALTARYGEDGSKAVFQMLREQNQQLDPGLYKQIQQIIEAGRNDFQREQNQLIDKLRTYENQRNSFYSGFWLRVAGFPRLDLSKYTIIVDDGVRGKFESKTDSAIKLR